MFPFGGTSDGIIVVLTVPTLSASTYPKQVSSAANI
jgi:hypothetical protein